MTLTKPDFQRIISKLCGAGENGGPKGEWPGCYGAHRLERIYNSFKGYSPEKFEYLVNEALDSYRFAPTPKELKETGAKIRESDWTKEKKQETEHFDKKCPKNKEIGLTHMSKIWNILGGRPSVGPDEK